jgi:hypothetical protein
MRSDRRSPAGSNGFDGPSLGQPDGSASPAYAADVEQIENATTSPPQEVEKELAAAGRGPRAL